MIYLILSILCSVLIANLLMVFNRRKDNDIVVIFLGNYFVAAIFSLLNSRRAIVNINWLELAFAAFAGFLFLYNFFVYHKSIVINGLSLSVGVMRTALIIPVLLSVLIFADRLSLLSGIGILIVLASFWLLSEKQKLRNIIWIGALFLITGATDISLKIVSVFGKMDQNLYLYFLFSAAYVFTLIWIIWQKRQIKWQSILFGFALGIPNQLSSLFFLKALQIVAAPVAYPIVASGVVLISIISDIVFWRRRYTLKQRFAFVLLILGIVFLNLQA